MQNRRRYKRYKVDVMEINVKTVLSKYVKILNMSIGGLLLQIEKRLSEGSQYTIKLEGKAKGLTAKGKVIWSFLSESIRHSGDIIPIYKTGMEFVDVTKEKMTEIANFIEVNKREDDMQVDLYSPDGLRHFVRVGIEDQEKAVVDVPEICKVKNLNLGGMLIESTHALEPETRLPMEMALTEDKSIKFLGRVTSCSLTKDKNLETFDIGIEFVEMPEKDKEILVQFISLLDTIDTIPPF